MLKTLLFLFFLLNALFWGLFSHQTHCSVASKFGMDECPPHWFHVYVLGVGSFVIALFLQQGTAGFVEFIEHHSKKIFSKVKEVIN